MRWICKCGAKFINEKYLDNHIENHHSDEDKKEFKKECFQVIE